MRILLAIEIDPELAGDDSFEHPAIAAASFWKGKLQHAFPLLDGSALKVGVVDENELEARERVVAAATHWDQIQASPATYRAETRTAIASSLRDAVRMLRSLFPGAREAG